MSEEKLETEETGENSRREPTLSRRDFIYGSVLAAAGVTATVAALSPLIHAKEVPTIDGLLQKHYKRLTAEDKQVIFKRLEDRVERDFGIRPVISDHPPLDGVEYAYALNIGRCIGCRKCVYACMMENNLSRNPQKQYIRVVKMKKGNVNLDSSSHDYPAEEAADSNFFYMPIQCQQCRKPPCVKVCPVKATWKETDGIIVIDYNWCIGCRYCEAACPYHARRFNFAKPIVPKDELNPDMGYLSNRPRFMGVMEKCTYCLHRTRVGKYPACHDACPTGARKFGDLRDPDSEIRKIVERERVYVLKQDMGTFPKFYYIFAK